MGEETEIGWCNHTFNYVWGCTKVSEGCENCYAEAWDKRTGGDHWGPNKPRRVMSDSYWQQPLKWNRKAEKDRCRRRVFCSSMADVFDHESPVSEREKLWKVIKQTPWLDWLLLTKRPQNAKKFLPPDWGTGYQNVWLGVTAENQKRADERISILLTIPAVVRFISAEPLLGPLDLWAFLKTPLRDESLAALKSSEMPGLDWVIVGGESGANVRPMEMEWVKNIVDQCKAAGVKVYVKQDSGKKNGQQGRIPNELWTIKDHPESRMKLPVLF